MTEPLGHTRYGGCTTLHNAAQTPHPQAAAGWIGALLDAGADINSRDATGATPLHYAAVNTNLAARRVAGAVLLKRGANPNVKDSRGLTPRDYAQRVWGGPNSINPTAAAAAYIPLAPPAGVWAEIRHGLQQQAQAQRSGQQRCGQEDGEAEGDRAAAEEAEPAEDPPAAAPTRVCAAPGCGATRSLRRCGGCASVHYCSEACSHAHWRAHKLECRRLQAERAVC